MNTQSWTLRDRSRRLAFRPSFPARFLFLFLLPLDALLSLIATTYRTYLWGMDCMSPRFLAWAGEVRARRARERAIRRVPAYRKFLGGRIGRDEICPETDKRAYIDVFSTEDRCVGGRIPDSSVAIDESSGSTGTPYNWVRTMRERRETHRFISYFARYCFGSDPTVTINAFSMGAWATGINMGLAMEKHSIVKNTGPDITKILSTLSFLGPSRRYLILGYPPFLKQIVDAAEHQGFPLDSYHLSALVGGEGMSEGLREYLLRRFRRVYSGYGATDLELGIAGETPVSVAIRRLARDNASVRERLFGGDSRLPMVFQYNPLMHHVEVNAEGELIVTISRASLLCPRIRYNVHDQGGILRYDEMAAVLAAEGYDIEGITSASDPSSMRLPFLWVFGRRDFKVSVMGANIYPEDVEQCVYADPELASITRSFCQSLSETGEGGVRPCFHFEVDSEPTEALRERFSASILKTLLSVNTDFCAAWHEFPETVTPLVELHRPGEGPFRPAAGQIKQTRLVPKASHEGSRRQPAEV